RSGNIPRPLVFGKPGLAAHAVGGVLRRRRDAVQAAQNHHPLLASGSPGRPGSAVRPHRDRYQSPRALGPQLLANHKTMDAPYTPPPLPPSKDSIARQLEGLQYPLTLSFKILALASQATVTDAGGRTVLHTRQKLFKF